MSETMRPRELEIGIDGMSCSACVARVERAITRKGGALSAKVNLATASALIEYDDADPAALEQINAAVETAGYTTYELVDPLSLERDESDEIERRASRRVLTLSAILSALIMGLAFGPKFGFGLDRALSSYLQFGLTSVTLFYCGSRFFVGAMKAARAFSADMNTLIALGSFSAYGYSAWLTFFPSASGVEFFYETAAMIITLILVGKYIETLSRAKAGDAIRSLIALRPSVAIAILDGNEIKIDIKDLRPGDVTLVYPGASFPADGVIVDGRSEVNESMLTGESIPIVKSVGDKVIGGSVNSAALVKVKATEVGAKSTLARIVALARRAQGAKAPIQRLADVISAYFVFVVTLIALCAGALWYLYGPEPRAETAMTIFVAVLIVACPCALGLATPTAIMVGVGVGARRGIFIRDGIALERAGKIGRIFFDKTGSLTSGSFELTEIEPAEGLTERDILRVAGAVERYSEHHIGRGIFQEARRREIDLPEARDFQVTPGVGVAAIIDDGRLARIESVSAARAEGVDLSFFSEKIAAMEAKGSTPLIVSSDGAAIGAIGVADAPRVGAREALARLREAGVAVSMITGDNATVARRVGAELGIDPVDIVAEATPSGKGKAIRAARDQARDGALIGMVGDGINDALALTEADIGFAIGSGTDVAIESAEILISRDEILDVLTAIRLSRAVSRRIKWNLLWAFGYNAALIPLAAGLSHILFGALIQPMFAAAAMALSSTSVILSSSMLKRFR